MPNQPQTTNLIAKALAKVYTVRPPTLPVSNLQRHTFTITARRQVFRMLFSGASQNSSPPASASVGGIFISLLFSVTSLASPGMAAAVRTDTRNIYCRCAQHSTQKPVPTGTETATTLSPRFEKVRTGMANRTWNSVGQPSSANCTAVSTTHSSTGEK